MKTHPAAWTRARSITLIVTSQLAAMALWFSASASVPTLIAEGRLSPHHASLLTGAVQLGFVAGTLGSAIFGLADRFDSRRLFGVCTLIGAALNAALLLTGFDGWLALVLRFGTGVSLAGVYPVGMKLAAGWAQGNMGVMIGALVGALTLGSALPHLFTAFGGLDGTLTIGFASASALLAAGAMQFARLGPAHGTYPRFRLAEAAVVLRQRSLLLAQGGYLGHMWELYAMWAWLGSFLAWALPAAGAPAGSVWSSPALITFVMMGLGAAGSLAAGVLADRIGRTAVTIAALLASGLCAATIGLAVDAGLVVLLVVAAIWGVTVVADSAQFSAAIAELADPRYVGTTLTLQTCLGFLLTIASIQLMPVVVATIGWQHAFSVLAIGPLLGAAAMAALRAHPDAKRIAGGRR